MKRLAMLLALTLVAGAATGAVVFEEDFSSYTNGQVIGNPDWNQKWDGGTNGPHLQRELWTGTGNGLAHLATDKAYRSYHIVGKNEFVVGSNQFATVYSDFQLDMFPGDALSPNHPFISLRFNSTSNWWEGNSASVSMAHRNAKWGSKVSGAPWQEGWNDWSLIGIDTSATRSTSDWFRIECTIEPGPSNYIVNARWVNPGDDSTIWTKGYEVELPIANGDPIYAGYSTEYNNVSPTGTIAEIMNITNIWMDNFTIKVENNPTEWTILEDDFESPYYHSTNDYHLEGGGGYSWWIQDHKGKTDPWNTSIGNPTAYIVASNVFGSVSNHVMKSDKGWRGIASKAHPFDIEQEELLIVEFDFAFDLGQTLQTAVLGHFCLIPEDSSGWTPTPEAPWTAPSMYWDGNGGTDGLSRQLSWNAWQGPTGTEYTNGQFVINMWNGVTEWYPADLMGISGDGGTNWASDVCRITFQYQKGFNGLWESITTISNMNTAATAASTQNVTSVTAWDSDDLVLCVQAEGLSGAGGDFWWAIDNVLGKRALGPALVPKGYDAWALDYELIQGIYGDDDNDDVINLFEYGLGGDPTNAADLGTPPEMILEPDDTVSFTHVQLTHPDAGISYHKTYKTDLVLQPTWSGAWDVWTNWNVDLEFNAQQVQLLQGGTNDQMFIKFDITRP